MRLFIVFFTLLATLFAQEIPWLNNYEAAKTQAAAEKKIIMVMFSQPACPTCIYMKENTFKDETVIDYLRFHFVSVELDIYKDKIPGFRPIGTPTFFFLDAKGKKIARPIFGGAKPKDFLEHLQTVRNDYLKQQN